MPDEPSDAELIGNTDGDETPFARLYERHAQDVLRYFMRRTGCPQTAADLTAETFAQALGSRRRFRDTGAPGRAWLFKIAQRQLSRFIRTEQVSDRARRRLGMRRLVLSDTDIDRIEELADFAQVRQVVRDAIGALPAVQSEAVLLRVGDGLPYRDVARRLGCSEGAARVRVSRGLHTLAEVLPDQLPDQLGETS